MTREVDISPAHREIVESVLREHLSTDVKVWVFGSRANWTTKDSSDLDLALEGESKLSAKVLGRLKDAFEDSELPYTVDVVDLNQIEESFKTIVESQRERFDLDQPRNMRLGGCIEINGDTYSSKEAWSTINYLDTGSITENRIIGYQHLELDKDKIPSRARRKVRPGDIVFSTVRPNQKHYGLLKSIPDNCLVSTGFIVLRGKEGVANTRFIYSYLTQDHVVDFLHSIAENSTSTYPSIRPSDLEQLPISLPPLAEQRAIARVLDALDDKIELNWKMSGTLEDMAHALFKSWFIDFDPVRAKSEGRPSGLPPHLDTLFPDRLFDSELGPIPEGWEVSLFGDEVKLKRQSIKPNEYPDEEFDHYSIPAFDANRRPCAGFGADIHSGKYLLAGRSILLSKLNPHWPRIWLTDVTNAQRRAVASTEFLVLSEGARWQLAFIYGLVSSSEFTNALASGASGTSRSHQRVRPADVMATAVAAPPLALVHMYSDVANPIFSFANWLLRQIGTLREARDVLLPYLVSGEFDVTDLGSELEASRV